MIKPSIAKQLSILEADLGRKSPRTRTYYRSISKRFLIKSGDFSRPGMIKYLDSVGCDNTVRTVYYVLKRLCKALGKTFPLDTEFLPPLPDEEQVYTPTMSVDNVRRLISYWRNYPGEYATSLLFLATVFGLRSIELASVEIKKSSMVVLVAKRKARRGVQVTREHPIPEDKMKYIGGYELFSEMTVKYTFWKICKRAGVKRQVKENWHSIRRSLNTACIDNNINRLLLKRFLRWAKDRRDMTDVYYHKEFSEVNKEMFKVHPFLKLW